MRRKVLTSLPDRLYADLVVTFADQLREPPRRGQEVEFDGVIFLAESQSLPGYYRPAEAKATGRKCPGR